MNKNWIVLQYSGHRVLGFTVGHIYLAKLLKDKSYMFPIDDDLITHFIYVNKDKFKQLSVDINDLENFIDIHIAAGYVEEHEK